MLSKFIRQQKPVYQKLCKACGTPIHNTKINREYCKLCATGKLRLAREEKKNYSKYWITIPNLQEYTIYERNCDCCGRPYKSVIYMDTKEVMRYCPEHRNEYKRNYYLKRNANANQGY